MNTHDKLKSDFKRLVEYQTIRITDVEEPHFVEINEEGEDEPELETDPEMQAPAPAPEAPLADNPPAPEPAPVEEPAPEPEPVAPEPVPAPAPAPEFNYTRVITNLNDITISLHKLNDKFEDIKSKMEYYDQVIDEVKEPSTEENLISMTKQSYPFNTSMVDAWKNYMTGSEEQEVIREPEGEIKKVGDYYEMEVNLDSFPKPTHNSNNSLGRHF